MNIYWYLAAVVSACVATLLTDWYFMGVLFHDRYLTYPDTWRFQGSGKAERLAIASSSLLGVVTCAVFIYICAALGPLDWWRAFLLAFGVWLAVPVPLLVTNGLFIRIHTLNTLALALGWLARLVICAIAARLFLG